MRLSDESSTPDGMLWARTGCTVHQTDHHGRHPSTQGGGLEPHRLSTARSWAATTVAVELTGAPKEPLGVEPVNRLLADLHVTARAQALSIAGMELPPRSLANVSSTIASGSVSSMHYTTDAISTENCTRVCMVPRLSLSLSSTVGQRFHGLVMAAAHVARPIHEQARDPGGEDRRAGKQKPPEGLLLGVSYRDHTSRSSYREGGVREGYRGRSPDSRIILLANAFPAVSPPVASLAGVRPRSQWRVHEGIAPSSQQFHLYSSNGEWRHS